MMTVATHTRGAPRKTSRPPRKVSKTYRLDAAQIESAREALGAKTATEAIERALDLVVFRRELIEGTGRMLGVRILPAGD